MPPKRTKSKTHNIEKPSVCDVLTICQIEQVLKKIKSDNPSSAGSVFASKIDRIKEDLQNSLALTRSAPLLDYIFHDVDSRISEILSTSNRKNSEPRIKKKSIKEEIIEEDEQMDTEPTTSYASSSSQPVLSTRMESPLMMSQATDDEMEEQHIPQTQIRMQQLSIERVPNPLHSAATPKKAVPKIPKRAPLFGTTPSRTGDKLQHASVIKQQILQSKVEKAKKGEEKRRLVLERKEERDQQKSKERHEEMKKKEEKAANILAKSPSRQGRNVPRNGPNTPTTRNLLFPSCSPTPGRKPAKFGRVFKNSGSNAKATVDISPSRNVPRNSKRVKPLFREEKASTSTKNLVKAKRNHKQQVDESKALQKAQEEFLLQQSKEEAERLKRDKEELERIRLEEVARLRLQSKKEEAEYEKTVEKLKQANQMGQSSSVGTYEMTPPRIYVASSKNDYGLDDLNSDDETDQEDSPRKQVPSWADFAVIRQNVRKDLLKTTHNTNNLYGTIPKLDLKLIFGDAGRTKKRGSSAVWRSPMITKPNPST